MITVRCKECGRELISTSKIQFCGCPNQMSVVDNKVGANDLDKVVMVSNNVENKIDSHFSRTELLYQEERRKRKVRKLDFESNRKSGRVVYGTGLENQRGCKSSVGSNPTSSVIIS